MRITKQLAEQIAEKLTEKKLTKIQEQKQKIKDYVTELILQKTPQEIIELSEKQKDYFRLTSSFRFNSADFQWQWFSTNKPIVTTMNHYEISKEENKKLFLLVKKETKLEDDYEKLKEEIQKALINMKTFKRVEIDFPEAVQYLPKNNCTSLVVNVDNIRKQLE